LMKMNPRWRKLAGVFHFGAHAAQDLPIIFHF
jgi:hypothetical protein